jgi:hypothetical protein
MKLDIALTGQVALIANTWTIEAIETEHRKKLAGLEGKVELLAGGPPLTRVSEEKFLRCACSLQDLIAYCTSSPSATADNCDRVPASDQTADLKVDLGLQAIPRPGPRQLRAQLARDHAVRQLRSKPATLRGGGHFWPAALAPPDPNTAS